MVRCITVRCGETPGGGGSYPRLVVRVRPFSTHGGPFQKVNLALRHTLSELTFGPRTPILFYVELPPPSNAVDLWDRTNERAVLNLVSPEFQSAFIDAQNKEPELFGLEEKDLYNKLKYSKRTPSPTDNRLRLAFWFEYDRAQSEVKPMEMARIFAGVCSKQFFYNQFLRSPSRVAWLLVPPAGYLVQVQEMLEFGLSKLRDILDREPINHKGQFDHKLAELQTKITLMMDQRLKGGIVQKVEQKTVGLQISTSDKQVAQAALGQSMEDLTKRLKELERKERETLNLPPKEKPREPVVVEAEVGESDGNGS